MPNAFIFAIYAMLAASVSLLLMAANVADAKGAALTGTVVLLLGMQIHGVLLRRCERRKADGEIAGLRRASQEFLHALEETHARIDEVKTAAAARAREQSRKIVAELKMLEGLMRECASRISEKSNEAEGGEETIELRTRGTARSYLDAIGQSAFWKPSVPRRK